MLRILAEVENLDFRTDVLWNAVFYDQGPECQSAMSWAGREDAGSFGENGDRIVEDQLEVVRSSSLVVDSI